MRMDRVTRMLMLYGVYVGVSLAAWWTAYAIEALPAALVPLDVTPSHIGAELVLAAALVLGGGLTGRGSELGRPVLIAALGGLAYATLNVIGDYLALLPGRMPMFMLLMVASASAVATLALAMRRTE
jgi:hypothetical protein